MISIRVMKICDDSFCQPLKFFVLFRKRKVSRWMEKSKWGSRSKSLRGYFMVESLIFLQQKNLTSDNQSDFKRDNSCINQFLSIIHKICQYFDDNLQTRASLIDISKAFDKVYEAKFLYTNSSKTAYQVKLWILSTDFFNWTKFLNHLVLKQGCLKGLYSNNYYFWFLLVTFLIIFRQMLSSLRWYSSFFPWPAMLILERLIWIMF